MMPDSYRFSETYFVKAAALVTVPPCDMHWHHMMVCTSMEWTHPTLVDWHLSRHTVPAYHQPAEAGNEVNKRRWCTPCLRNVLGCRALHGAASLAAGTPQLAEAVDHIIKRKVGAL